MTPGGPAPSTLDPAYARRAHKSRHAGWKRLLPVQAPYRAHLRRLTRGRLVLEVGCGTGRNLAHMAGAGGAIALGIDHNETAVGLARSEGLNAMTTAEFAAWRAGRHLEFDTLLFAHIVEHLTPEGARQLLADYLPLLRPGGELILITPQPAGQRRDPTHVTYFDFAGHAALCRNFGLECRGRYSFPFPRVFGRLFVYNEWVSLWRRPVDPATPSRPYARLAPVLLCPRCRASGLRFGAGAAVCVCGGSVPGDRGVWRYVESPPATTVDAGFQQAAMDNRGTAARLYNFGRRVISSDFVVRDLVEEAVRTLPPGAVAIELGSGRRRLRGDIINIDLFPFANVDAVMDIGDLHIADGVADLVVLDSVIEHVPEPARVIGEALRILKPGGRLICVAPWLFPYHGYPHNFFNFSADGLRELLRGFSQVSLAVHHGPTAALTNIFTEYVAVAVGGRSRLLYVLAKGLALLPVFWLKYLDILWARSDRGLRVASTICAVAVK